MAKLNIRKAHPRKKAWETSALPSALWWVEQAPGLIMGRKQQGGTLKGYSSLFPAGGWAIEAWIEEWRPLEWVPGQDIDSSAFEAALIIEQQLRGQEFATRTEALQAIELALQLA